MGNLIPLAAPDITSREIDAVSDVLRSGSLTGGGRLEEFEGLCAKYAGRREGIAVSSGTAAMHCMLLASGIGGGDEVITTPFSYPSTANCILTVGAKPIFVDINPTTLNLDPAAVEAAITPKTRAIIAVESLGNPGGLEELEQLARRHEIMMFENACEGFGSRLDSRAVGSFGRASCLSFYATKQITTGEGGMILTDDDRFAAACRTLRNHGREDSSGATCARLGFSYRMSEINAALGLAQIGRLEEILQKRRSAARAYFGKLIDNRYVTLPTIAENVRIGWYAFVVKLNDLFERGDRDEMINQMHSGGVETSGLFPPVHLQPHIMEAAGTRRGMFPVCEFVAERTLALPLFTTITPTQVDRVCEVLDEAIEKVLMGRCKGRF